MSGNRVQDEYESMINIYKHAITYQNQTKDILPTTYDDNLMLMTTSIGFGFAIPRLLTVTVY